MYKMLTGFLLKKGYMHIYYTILSTLLKAFFPPKYEFMRKYTSELFQCGTL